MFVEQVGGEPDEPLLDRADPAGIGAGRMGREPAEHQGRVLERLALDQPGEQEVALLPQAEFVVEIDVGVVGQEPSGLQLDERRCDQQELGGDFEIEPFHLVELDEIRIDDLRQVDLVEIDLLS